MAYDFIAARRRRSLVFGVLATAIIASTLVAVALFYLSQTRPHF